MKPLFACFSQNLDYALGWMVIHSLWQATLIAFITGALNIALRKKTARLRYIVSNVSLFMVLAMSIATFCYHYDFNKEARDIVFIETQATAQPITIQQYNDSVLQAPLSIEAFKDYFNHNLPLIVTIWVLGVALFILKLLGSMSYIYYLKSRLNFPTDEYWNDMMHRLANKAGIKKSIELVESAIVRTPMVIGHLKPMILFPLGVINKLSAQEVEAILAHELAHVLRHDYIFNILQSVVEALFYFHPAVWWLSSQIRNERESACDEIAIDLINSKINFAKALVTIQEMAFYPMSPALAFAGQRKNQFVMRMQRILNQPNHKSNVMEKIVATSLIIVTLVGLSMAQNKGEKAKTDTPQYSTPQPSPSPMPTPNAQPFTNITTIGDTLKDPFYTVLPATPEILKLQKELAEMELTFPQFEKEKLAEIEKLKVELAEMEGGTSDFEKKKLAEIVDIEKEIAGMKSDMPKVEKEKEAEIEAILKNIKEKEANLDEFTKKVDAENKTIEAKIAELNKEKEGKTGTKRSRVDGDIQGLYGEIQGNLGEVQGKRGEIQGLYGEIQSIRGDLQGNHGELQGKFGEIQGKRGEMQGHRGEIQGKRGEIQGIRGEIQGSLGEIQGKRGEIQGKYTELIYKSLVADLKSDNLITDDKKLYLKLNSKEFSVNNVKQSDALHSKYVAKYLKGNKRGFEIFKRNGNLNFSMDDDDN